MADFLCVYFDKGVDVRLDCELGKCERAARVDSGHIKSSKTKEVTEVQEG
jgi:hypothetical protein